MLTRQWVDERRIRRSREYLVFCTRSHWSRFAPGTCSIRLSL